MNDEELMRGVAKALRDELEAEAALPGSVESDAYVLDPRTRDELVDAVLQEVNKPRPSMVVRKAPKVTGWHRARAYVTVAIAAAAALVLVLRSSLAPASLPSYESIVRGGERTFRSEHVAEPLRLRPSSELEWVLRPAHPVRGKLAVRTFYRQAKLEPWLVAAEISEQGSVRVSGRVADLQLPLGRTTLIAVIADAARAPRDASEVDRQLTATDTGWRIVSTVVEVER